VVAVPVHTRWRDQAREPVEQLERAEAARRSDVRRGNSAAPATTRREAGVLLESGDIYIAEYGPEESDHFTGDRGRSDL